MALFDVECVTYQYYGVTALRGVSLNIREGSRVALLGANGSGKSTMLRLLDGLSFPDSGTVRFRGDILTEHRFRDDAFSFGFRRQVGFLFQATDHQLFSATVFDEVAFGPAQLGLTKAVVSDRVLEMLAKLNILELRDRAPYRLSGGEKQRVALASILVLDPAVLLLDEPADSLDPRGQKQILDLLEEWAGQAKTVVLATHNLVDLNDIVDYCYILRDGEIAGHGEPRDILMDQDLLVQANLAHGDKRSR